MPQPAINRRRKATVASLTQDTFQFDSESLLQQAIAGLLSRMPSVTSVQILQGAQEYGKDIIFCVPGGLADTLLCACVVKNTVISGQVSSNSGARTVYLQAQQALDTPHTTGNGNEEYVQRVYIVTPYPIAPTAIAAIGGALKEKKGQVTFVGGPALFDLFRRYWPDFVADEADSISAYLADSKRVLEEGHPIAEVAAMYQLGAIDKAATWIHVPQAFCRTLTTYRPGDAVEQLITVDDIDHEWTKEELHRWKLKVQKLDSVISTVSDWGFIAHNASDSFHRTSDELIQALTSGWSNALQSKLRVDAKDLETRAGPKASVFLEHRANLKQRAEDLRATANGLLASGIDVVSDSVRNLINSNIDAEELLSSDFFEDACGLTDLAATLPPGFLEMGQSKTWDFGLASLESGSSFLLVGAAGYGKTSFCRWRFLDDAEKLRCHASDIVPVYVPLHRLAKHKLAVVDDLYQGALGRSGLLSGALEYCNKLVRVYLDGLDEVADEAQRESIVRLSRQGIESREDLQIIITARDYVNGPWLRWLPRLSLRGFTPDQIDSLVTQWLKGKEEDIERFRIQLRTAPELTDLMSVPLLATLIVLVFKQTRRLPEGKPRIYDIFIDLMCEGWNLAKGILRPSRFGLRAKKAVLGRIALSSHRRKSRSFLDADIRDAVTKCVAKTVCQDWTQFRDELLQDCLINRAGSLYQFAHFSFQEFLAARQLLGEPSHSQMNRALKDYLSGDDWWLEALRFYIGLSGTPSETYAWIANKAEKAADSVLKETDSGDLEERVEELLKSVRQIFPEAPIRI
jgi:hypothetical protein